jgi:hypothetical protein
MAFGTKNSPTLFSKYKADKLSGFSTAKEVKESEFDRPDEEYRNYIFGMINSTQQLHVDWSKFENHTFFNSAEANVNTAFDAIINKFPFDGTRKDINAFMVGLTGFERHVFDRFPKNTGYLIFDNSMASPPFLSINDLQGSDEIVVGGSSKGERILNPGTNPFSIEAHIFSPKAVNDNQIICQKIESNNIGFSLVLSASSSTTKCQLQFIIASGSMVAYEEIPFTKGEFNHICAVFDKTSAGNAIKIYNNAKLITESSDYLEMVEISPKSETFLIASGTSIMFNSVDEFEPQETFNGYLDEFRFFHSARTIEDLEYFGKKTIFANDDLQLYLKFNEPYDEDAPTNTPAVVLDSSGNSLHSFINNFHSALRMTGSLPTHPIDIEDTSIAPVLFPQVEALSVLNAELLASASLYDQNNPNLITRLIPPHYFLEGMNTLKSDERGFGTIDDAYTGSNVPGKGQLGTAQMMTAILLMWGKFFDELKIVLDHFSNVTHARYADEESALTTFMPALADYYGFELPTFFDNASLDQYINGNDIGKAISSSELSLQYIQSQLWKRILVNINDIYKSKGTISSIESFLRSAGIDSDSLLRIREYGGNVKKDIIYSRQQKTEVSTMLDMSASLASVTPFDAGLSDKTYSNMPFVRSDYLSGSRIEPGIPIPVGDMSTGESDDRSDGLYTTGSFMLEGIYSFPQGRDYPVTQSLMRLNVDGDVAPSAACSVVANVIALSSSVSPDNHILKCYFSPSTKDIVTSDDIVELVLTGANIFDGQKWNVSIGRNHFSEIDSIQSSSYYLKCARQVFGDVKEFYSTSAFFDDAVDGTDIFSTSTNDHNKSGAFFTIGRQAFDASTPKFLNNNSPDVTDEAYSSVFGGKVGHLRMWSKSFTDKVWKEHVKNYTSLGVESPFENFNFNTVASGSFSRLRLDTSTDQSTTGSNSAGELEIFDYSQNEHHLSCKGFGADTQVIKPESFHFGIISSKFDMLQVTNKIRARGLEKEYNADESMNAVQGLMHELTKRGEFFDDPRFSIEFSSIDALNEDIVKMFSSLDIINDILGAPNNVFADSYQDLEKLQDIYFNRLTDKISLDAYFELFKWFNDTFTQIIVQLIPRKTNYMGTNFIIESHLLERHRFKYSYDDIYMQSTERDNSRGNLFLSQIVGTIKKF